MKFIEWLYKNSFNIFFAGLSFALFLMILITQIKIIILSSESVPYKVCVQVYKLKPHKGDLCVFDFKGRKFLKYIVGTAGDEIKYVGKVVYVCLTRVGEVKTTKHLTTIPEGKIPEGYVFMAGTHEDSFDSRYKEFGLVSVSDIRGKAFGCLQHWR